MKRFGLLVIAISVSLMFWAPPGHAQEARKRFIQARQLMMLERYDQAMQLLEMASPTSEEEWQIRENLLAEIYRGQKNYAGLELLVHGALARNPARHDRDRWQFQRAELYLLADLIDSARTLLDSLWHADVTDTTIAKVAELYEQHTLADWAQSTYLQARDQLGDSTVYAFQLAVLFESRRDYARSTQEYFRAIARDSSIARRIENRLLKLLETTDGDSPMEQELQKAAARSGSAATANRLLVTLYLESGRPDDAWKSAWIVDSVNGQNGLSLIVFMRQAYERDYQSVAMRAARRILSAYPRSPVRHQAEWELARMALKSGDAADAREQLVRISKTSPVLRYRLEASLAYAELAWRTMGDLQVGESVYAAVVYQQPGGQYFHKAMLGRAMIASMQGDYGKVRTLLVNMEIKKPRPRDREQLTYRLGELAWFEGDLKNAMATWSGLITDYPKGVWVNDALRYNMLLSAYSEIAPADLRALGKAEAQARMNHPDSALQIIAGLRGSFEAPLAPTALLLAARIHRDAGQADSALALWDEFVEAYPDAADAPRALMMAAELCERVLSRPETARDRYHRLLEIYPRSHWTEEARLRLRTLGQL